MSWSIDIPVRVGELAVVPIVSVSVAVEGDAHRCAGHGEKRPTLFLVLREDEVIGLDVAGRVHDTQAVERRYPKAIAKAIARLAEEDD